MCGILGYTPMTATFLYYRTRKKLSTLLWSIAKAFDISFIVNIKNLKISIYQEVYEWGLNIHNPIQIKSI